MEGTIVSDVLSSPDIGHSRDDTLKSQRNGVGFSHLGNEDEHQERTSVKVSDGDFSEEKITSKIGKTNFMN